MRTKVLTAVTIVLGMATCASAFAPLGPPTADLKKGQFKVGFDYDYSRTDIKVDVANESIKLDNNKTNFYVTNLGYAPLNDWEVFGRLGMANARGGFYGYQADGDYRFAWGVGTKVTFLKRDNISWGVVFQANWMKSEDSVDGIDVSIKAVEIEFAAGPVYKLLDNVYIYGGPVVHFLGGNIDIEGIDISMEDGSDIGGYIGLKVDISQNLSWYGEYRLDPDVSAFGTGISWKF